LAEPAGRPRRGVVASGDGPRTTAGRPGARDRIASPARPAGRRSGRAHGTHAPGRGGTALPRPETTPRIAARARRGRHMTHHPNCDEDREARLNGALLAYVEARQAGREPDRAELLAAHPDLRDDLREFFAGHDEVERIAAPLRHDVTPDIGQLG